MGKMKEVMQALEECNYPETKEGARPISPKAAMYAGWLLATTTVTNSDESIKASEAALDSNVFKRDLLGILVKYGDRPVATRELSLGERYAVRRAWDENLMDLTEEGFSLTAQGVKFVQSLGDDYESDNK